MLIVCEQGVANYSTVTRWCKNFRQGRDSIVDAPKSGRFTDAVTDNSLRAVEKLIMDDSKIKIAEIVLEFNMSTGSIENIIHGYLDKTKVSAR